MCVSHDLREREKKPGGGRFHAVVLIGLGVPNLVYHHDSPDVKFR
jgi:hypothetical protein